METTFDYDLTLSDRDVVETFLVAAHTLRNGTSIMMRARFVEYIKEALVLILIISSILACAAVQVQGGQFGNWLLFMTTLFLLLGFRTAHRMAVITNEYDTLKILNKQADADVDTLLQRLEILSSSTGV